MMITPSCRGAKIKSPTKKFRLGNQHGAWGLGKRSKDLFCSKFVSWGFDDCCRGPIVPFQCSLHLHADVRVMPKGETKAYHTQNH